MPKSLGGAATNKGIWYQALWCVLQASRALINAAEGDVRLVLEPSGGDVEVTGVGHRRVIQLKSSARPTWSLHAVVTEVLPNLLEAVEPRNDVTTYEFVTDGEIGDWTAVQAFFSSLSARRPHLADAGDWQEVYRLLDDRKQLRFGGCRSGFWGDSRTEKRIIDRVVRYLATQRAMPPDADDIELRTRTLRLLAGFRFEPRRSEQWVRSQVDRELLAIVDYRENVPAKRDALVGAIIRAARENNTWITPGRLFEDAGVPQIAHLAKRTTLTSYCARTLEAQLQQVGYRADHDVRPRDVLFDSDSLCMAIDGESGHGKSWCLYRAAYDALTSCVVLLRFSKSLAEDLQSAADIIWQKALGHDSPIAIHALSRRLRELSLVDPTGPWLTIAVDGVSEVNYFDQFLSVVDAACGVRLIAACGPAAGEAARVASLRGQQVVKVQSVAAFTSNQRDEYLKRRLGESWTTLSSKTRDLLRTPLLASIYCDLAEDGVGYAAETEYSLLDRYWKRMFEFDRFLQDDARLRKLAATLINSAPYPWDHAALNAAGIDELVARRLAAVGWLRMTADRKFEIPHARLLNFAVAKQLAVDGDRDDAIKKTLGGLFAKFLNRLKPGANADLSRVPMDWVYLRAPEQPARVRAVVQQLREVADFSGRDELYSTLLPGIGAVAIPILFDLLRSEVESENWYEARAIVKGLCAFPAELLRAEIESLLRSTNPKHRRAALRVLESRPSFGVLDLAWTVYADMHRAPEPYQCSDEVEGSSGRDSPLWRYDDPFAGLRACARLDPKWIGERIRTADPVLEPVHDLAYLAANIHDDGEVWRSAREAFFSKVPREKRRALAVNARAWRDAECVDWLESVVEIEEDALGPTALWALAVISPASGICALARVSEHYLYLFRSSYLPRLIQASPHPTRRAILERIRRAGDPLKLALVYQGYENLMDRETFAALLDELARRLTIVVNEGGALIATERRVRCDALGLPLLLLEKVSRGDCLEELIARRGTQLENDLAEVLIRFVGPRQTLGVDLLMRKPAVRLLQRIGGSGHSRVCASFLDSPSWYGQIDAIEETYWSSDASVIEKLRQIAAGPSHPDCGPLLSYKAMKSLAAIGDVIGLLAAMAAWRGSVPADLDKWMHRCPMHAMEAASSARQIVASRTSGSIAAAIQMLALLGQDNAVEEICTALVEITDEAELRSAICGLGWLGAGAAHATGTLRDYLADKRYRYAARIALQRIGTPEAHEALLTSLTIEWGAALAGALTHHADSRSGAVAKAVEHFRQADPSGANLNEFDVATFLEYATEGAVAQVLHELPGLADDVREAAFDDHYAGGCIGGRFNAVRALAAVDPYAATEAARRALGDANDPERQRYPQLLYRLAPEMARVEFLRRAGHEQKIAVRWAMAYSLSELDSSWLREILCDTAQSQRLAAIQLSRFLIGVDDQLFGDVDRLVEQAHSQVSDAAEEVSRYGREYRLIEDLVDRLTAETGDVSTPWTLIDAICSFGDVGYEGAPWPPWISRVLESATVRQTPALRSAFSERVAKLRRNARAQ